MNTLIKKSVFPALVVAHIIVRFFFVDASETKLSPKESHLDRLSAISLEHDMEHDLATNNKDIEQVFAAILP